MLKIRLQRVGRKHESVFRVVLVESKNSTKSGRFQEILGLFDKRDKKRQTLNAERVKYWISKGAQLSETLNNYLVSKKIIEGEKKNVLSRRFSIKKEEVKK